MTQDQIDYLVRSNVELLGATGDEDLFNGSSFMRASKPQHVKTLLEERGIVPEVYPGQHADEYCLLTDIWLHEDSPVLWEQISGLFPVGRKANRAGVDSLIARFGHTVWSWLYRSWYHPVTG